MIRKKSAYPYFLLLCGKEREELYKKIISRLPHKIILMNSIEQLIRHCLVEDPPLGVLVDVATSIQTGTEQMATLYNLKVRWPIMRCNIMAGSPIVLCLNPCKNEPLPNALDSIAAGDESWDNPHSRRNDIRLTVECRTRISRIDEKKSTLGNLLNMSRSGSFVLTYGSFEPDEKVILEILDISDTPLRCRAKTVWSRGWDDSIQLPGIGILFDRNSIESLFDRVIAEIQSRGKLFKKIREE